MAYVILLISPGRWLQAKTQQPIGVVSLVIIIHVNVLDRRNPFEEYDDVKFRERFRLSKFAVTKLLDEVFAEHVLLWSV